MRRARSSLPPGFGTIWTTVAVDLIGFGIVLPVLPLYAERFGATPTQIGALLASFSVAQLLFAPVWGWVSDRIGRKPVLVLSLAGTAVGSVLTGLAGSLTILFFARVLDGISGASVSVAQVVQGARPARGEGVSVAVGVRRVRGAVRGVRGEAGRAADHVDGGGRERGRGRGGQGAGRASACGSWSCGRWRRGSRLPYKQ